MKKLFEEKIAPQGKMLKATIDDEVVITNRVTAPLGTDLSMWEEIDENYGIEKEIISEVSGEPTH